MNKKMNSKLFHTNRDRKKNVIGKFGKTNI